MQIETIKTVTIAILLERPSNEQRIVEKYDNIKLDHHLSFVQRTFG